MSQAFVHGDIVYLAGQVGEPGDDVSSQKKAALAQIGRLLEQAGSDRSRILSATIWLADMADFDVMNSVWDTWIDGNVPPARTTGEVKLASPDYQVEIIMIAARV